MSAPDRSGFRNRLGSGGAWRTDVALAFVLGVAAEFELWLVAPTHHHARPVTAVAIAVLAAAVAVRRRAPLAAVTVGFAAIVVQEARGGAFTHDLVISLLFPVVIMYGVGASMQGRRAVFALALAIVLILVDVALAAPDSEASFSLMLVVVPWVFGQILGERHRRAVAFRNLAEQLQAERAGRDRAAILDERARIARELHDLIAHGVSVMTLQVAGARRCLDTDPGRAGTMVLAAEETGRAALAEIRRLFGVLRTDERSDMLSPQPGIGQLEELIERARATGVDATVRVEGDDTAISPGVDLAAFRTVEALLGEHAGADSPSHVAITVRRRPASIELDIVDRPGSANGHGRDVLASVRERIALYGGTFGEERVADHRRIRATLPTQGAPA